MRKYFWPVAVLAGSLALLFYIASHPARADGLPDPVPVVQAAAVNTASNPWAGAYAGVHLGYAWGNVDVKDNAKDGVAPGPFSYDDSGVFGGGTAGYNLQFERLVIGIEGDLGYMNLEGHGIIGSAHADHHQDLTLDGGLYGDVTGRAGILLTPTTLIYGKGGFAFYDGEANQATTADGYSSKGTSTFTGWVAGGGIEQMIAPNISLKLEYLRFQFDSEGGAQTSLTDPPIGHVYANSHSPDADTVKAGLNIHF